jgi:hypothetical protein
LSNKWFHVTCIPWEIQVFLDHGPMTGREEFVIVIL